MKISLTKISLYLITILFFSACDIINNGNGDSSSDNYLTDYKLEASYLPQVIELAFDQVSGDYDELDYIKEKAVNGVMVYKISYYTSFQGELKTASGLVCFPIGDGPFPVMSYQNGTNTLHSNAPSVNPDYEYYLLLEMVASTGFVVVIPDYLGFGDSSDMFHPYLDKTSSNKSILDMNRAVKEMAKHLDVELSGNLYIAGYSQGGWATLQLQKEIEQSYSGEFDLQASACGAGPYDLEYVNQYITEQTTYPQPYFLGYMINSYTNIGEMTTEAGDVFNEPYASKISTLYDGTLSGTEINAELTTTVSDLLTADYIASYDTGAVYSSLMDQLEENSISAWETETPTLLVHGLADTYIPSKVSTDLYQNFLSLGVGIDQVLWKGLSGTDHTGGIVPFGLASVKWFLELEEESASE